ncbi:NAD(P)-dependent oxidoreductase [Rhodobacterales bacterium 52_120_T64]|nr:NAD(P)-dependent oxidoreductase [Rhodobacterales bacterium 52_120_T64]
MIVVFGATGTIGTPLVTALLAKGVTVRAVTSDPAKLAGLKALGCEAALASFDDPDALAQACKGATKAFLVTPAHLDMRRWKANVITAAANAGVKHMVMSTGLGASPKARLVFGVWHSESQELLKASGMDWTFIQPTYFMQNLLWQADSIAQGVYLDDLGGPVSWVDARDIADVTAKALTGEGHAGKAYGLTGAQALDGKEIAALFGKEITLRPVSTTDARAAMIASGMGPEVAEAMVELSTLAPKGYLAGTETTVMDVLNRPARSISDFIAENSTAFDG